MEGFTDKEIILMWHLFNAPWVDKEGLIDVNKPKLLESEDLDLWRKVRDEATKRGISTYKID